MNEERMTRYFLKERCKCGCHQYPDKYPSHHFRYVEEFVFCGECKGGFTRGREVTKLIEAVLFELNKMDSYAADHLSIIVKKSDRIIEVVEESQTKRGEAQ